ncbi:hypothetical protein FH972_027207 [Carpinus fangiana]|uniref:Uncharacterized protein n=1 Tax=Carpinus fangiana TaxID=176857 RepID=A0A5N6L8S3_9ROSI|nr:hypothetical protein FH972_027207 [Carpinus fangiana]
MDQNLKDAAEQGNIDALYLLIAMEPKVLDKMDEIPFVEMPLHVAAVAGQTEFAMEMMMLNYVTSRKETALHVALKNDKLDAFQVLVGWLRRAWFEKAESQGRRLLNAHDLNVMGSIIMHVQVVRWILDLGARVNLRNLEDFTPMDIAQEQTQVDNQKMRNILRCAGAKRASSLSTLTFADYLRSPIPTNEKLFT